MVKILRTCIPILLLVMAAGCDRGAHPAQTGKLAPDFNVSDGETSVHLASLQGHVVLLNFWWSQCGPCILELPSLLDFHHQHPEVTIVGVSIDEDADAYHRFLQQRHVDFLTVRDPNQTVANKYTTEQWPETYVIDRNGMTRRRFIGATDWNDPEIARYLKTL